MVDGILGGSMEFLSPILIVNQKSPSSASCNLGEVNSITGPSTSALQKGREIF